MMQRLRWWIQDIISSSTFPFFVLGNFFPSCYNSRKRGKPDRKTEKCSPDLMGKKATHELIRRQHFDLSWCMETIKAHMYRNKTISQRMFRCMCVVPAVVERVLFLYRVTLKLLNDKLVIIARSRWSFWIIFIFSSRNSLRRGGTFGYLEDLTSPIAISPGTGCHSVDFVRFFGRPFFWVAQ
jgi:hypothetical protein